MKLDSYTIAAIAMRLKAYLDYKTVKSVRKIEIVDYLKSAQIAAIRKNFEFHEKRKQFTSPIFSDLSNLYGSHVINIDTIMAVIIDYYVRTGKPMNYNTKMTHGELKDRLKFLSVLGANSQLDTLSEIHSEYKEQSTFNKFSGQKLTLFNVDEKQENKLYELVKTGKLSFLFYVFFWSNSKFDIDEDKIEDLNFLKFVRLMKYAKTKEITIEKIKYEV